MPQSSHDDLIRRIEQGLSRNTRSDLNELLNSKRNCSNSSFFRCFRKNTFEFPLFCKTQPLSACSDSGKLRSYLSQLCIGILMNETWNIQYFEYCLYNLSVINNDLGCTERYISLICLLLLRQEPIPIEEIWIKTISHLSVLNKRCSGEQVLESPQIDFLLNALSILMISNIFGFPNSANKFSVFSAQTILSSVQADILKFSLSIAVNSRMCPCSPLGLTQYKIPLIHSPNCNCIDEQYILEGRGKDIEVVKKLTGSKNKRNLAGGSSKSYHLSSMKESKETEIIKDDFLNPFRATIAHLLDHFLRMGTFISFKKLSFGCHLSSQLISKNNFLARLSSFPNLINEYISNYPEIYDIESAISINNSDKKIKKSNHVLNGFSSTIHATPHAHFAKLLSSTSSYEQLLSNIKHSPTKKHVQNILSCILPVLFLCLSFFFPQNIILHQNVHLSLPRMCRLPILISSLIRLSGISAESPLASALCLIVLPLSDKYLPVRRVCMQILLDALQKNQSGMYASWGALIPLFDTSIRSFRLTSKAKDVHDSEILKGSRDQLEEDVYVNGEELGKVFLNARVGFLRLFHTDQEKLRTFIHAPLADAQEWRQMGSWEKIMQNLSPFDQFFGSSSILKADLALLLDPRKSMAVLGLAHSSTRVSHILHDENSSQTSFENSSELTNASSKRGSNYKNFENDSFGPSDDDEALRSVILNPVILPFLFSDILPPNILPIQLFTFLHEAIVSVNSNSSTRVRAVELVKYFMRRLYYAESKLTLLSFCGNWMPICLRFTSTLPTSRSSNLLKDLKTDIHVHPHHLLSERQEIIWKIVQLINFAIKLVLNSDNKLHNGQHTQTQNHNSHQPQIMQLHSSTTLLGQKQDQFTNNSIFDQFENPLRHEDDHNEHVAAPTTCTSQESAISPSFPSLLAKCSMHALLSFFEDITVLTKAIASQRDFNSKYHLSSLQQASNVMCSRRLSSFLPSEAAPVLELVCMIGASLSPFFTMFSSVSADLKIKEFADITTKFRPNHYLTGAGKSFDSAITHVHVSSPHHNTLFDWMSDILPPKCEKTTFSTVTHSNTTQMIEQLVTDDAYSPIGCLTPAPRQAVFDSPLHHDSNFEQENKRKGSTLVEHQRRKIVKVKKVKAHTAAALFSNESSSSSSSSSEYEEVESEDEKNSVMTSCIKDDNNHFPDIIIGANDENDKHNHQRSDLFTPHMSSDALSFLHTTPEQESIIRWSSIASKFPPGCTQISDKQLLGGQTARSLWGDDAKEASGSRLDSAINTGVIQMKGKLGRASSIVRSKATSCWCSNSRIISFKIGKFASASVKSCVIEHFANAGDGHTLSPLRREDFFIDHPSDNPSLSAALVNSIAQILDILTAIHVAHVRGFAPRLGYLNSSMPCVKVSIGLPDDPIDSLARDLLHLPDFEYVTAHDLSSLGDSLCMKLFMASPVSSRNRLIRVSRAWMFGIDERGSLPFRVAADEIASLAAFGVVRGLFHARHGPNAIKVVTDENGKIFLENSSKDLLPYDPLENYTLVDGIPNYLLLKNPDFASKLLNKTCAIPSPTALADVLSSLAPFGDDFINLTHFFKRGELTSGVLTNTMKLVGEVDVHLFNNKEKSEFWSGLKPLSQDFIKRMIKTLEPKLSFNMEPTLLWSLRGRFHVQRSPFEGVVQLVDGSGDMTVVAGESQKEPGQLISDRLDIRLKDTLNRDFHHSNLIRKLETSDKIEELRALMVLNVSPSIISDFIMDQTS